MSNFFQGGGGSDCLFAIETHITCNFPGGGGGVRTLCPPSGSALSTELFILFTFRCNAIKHYVRPRKKNCVVQVTRPILNFYPLP